MKIFLLIPIAAVILFAGCNPPPPPAPPPVIIERHHYHTVHPSGDSEFRAVEKKD